MDDFSIDPDLTLREHHKEMDLAGLPPLPSVLRRKPRKRKPCKVVPAPPWYREMMDGQRCDQCGRGDRKLTWHHHSEKTANVSELRNHLVECIAEMCKCRLMCWECHRREHWKGGGSRVE